MLVTLQATKQRSGKDLMEYIKRVRDVVLDCYNHCEEKILVEICITNMIRGVLSRFGKPGNLPVCAVVAKS